MAEIAVSSTLGDLDGSLGQFSLGGISSGFTPPPPLPGSLALVKSVVGGSGVPGNWTLQAAGPTPLSGAGGVPATNVTPGTYTLSETAGPPGYTAGAWVCVGGVQVGNQVTIGAGQTVVCSIVNTFVPPPPVGSSLYIVRAYKFVSEPMPADTVFFTPWSNLSWPYEKTARNLVLTIDTGGVPCTIAVQADGQTVASVQATTVSNDRDRTIALPPNLIGKMWRLALTPGPGGKAQLFAAALDHIREPGGVLFYDSLEQDYGFIGFKVNKQGWISYKSASTIGIQVLVDGGLNFFSISLPAHPTRDIERFFFPVINNGVRGKSKKFRIQIMSSQPFFLYADSIIEFIPIGQQQRRSFSLMSVHPEQQQPISSPTLGQWNALTSIASAGRSVSS